MKIFVAAAAFAALALPYASGQSVCQGSALTGTVRDSTQALIPGATLTLDGSAHVTSGPDGRYRFGCVADGSHQMAVAEDGFAARQLALKTPRAAALDVVLQLEAVETNVEVDGDQTPATSATASGPTQTLSGSRLQALADDPDDLLRELQQLAAGRGRQRGQYDHFGGRVSGVERAAAEELDRVYQGESGPLFGGVPRASVRRRTGGDLYQAGPEDLSRRAVHDERKSVRKRAGPVFDLERGDRQAALWVRAGRASAEGWQRLCADAGASGYQ